MNFMFEWQEQYLTRSLRSLVRYCSCHGNIKFHIPNIFREFPKISEDVRKFPKIAEDFRGRPEDVSMIHQRI